MQSLLLVVILATILTVVPLFVLSDTDISAADADIPNNKATVSTRKASNSSASATITMTGIFNG